jgi:glycosyltransferase involved in cell wall biosynthesis
MRTIYVTHNEIGSPLVRSQVLPYLRRLAATGTSIDLVSFERGTFALPADELGPVEWHGLRATQGRSLIAKAADVLRGLALVVRLVHRRNAVLLHARSYLPAAICAVAGVLTRRPFIFDMRGFLGDEFVDAGLWSERDSRYRAVRVAEGVLLKRAAEVVVLTHKAERRLRTEPRYRDLVRAKNITVVPCAVDLERFRPAAVRDDRPTLVYSGSVGTWYDLDTMLKLFAATRVLVPGLRFLVLNRSDHQLVRSALERHSINEPAVELRAADFADVPASVASAHVGLCVLRRVGSKSGSSPIKVAEYLACGLPVVVDDGQGDIPDLILRYRAGHVITGYADERIARAAEATASLLTNADARANARHLAEIEFDVDEATARYVEIYERARRQTRELR